MTARAWCNAAAALWLAAGPSAASALDLQQLQSMLQAAPVQGIAFHELRESPWLATPIESRGTLHSSRERLEKRVVTPRRETWRLLPDRMEVEQEGAPVRRIMFKDAPAVQALANALRRTVAADLLALADDFVVEVTGDDRQWSVRLQPRDAAVARQIERLELQGSGARLQMIVVVERQGERTSTRLQYPAP